MYESLGIDRPFDFDTDIAYSSRHGIKKDDYKISYHFVLCSGIYTYLQYLQAMNESFACLDIFDPAVYHPGRKLCANDVNQQWIDVRK